MPTPETYDPSTVDNRPPLSPRRTRPKMHGIDFLVNGIDFLVIGIAVGILFTLLILWIVG